MTAWVKGKAQNGQAIFLNIDAAVRIIPLNSGLTRVVFPGSDENFADVVDKPDYLIQTADGVRR